MNGPTYPTTILLLTLCQSSDHQLYDLMQLQFVYFLSYKMGFIKLLIILSTSNVKLHVNCKSKIY